MKTKPSLETCAALYAAACAIQPDSHRLIATCNVVTAAERHGYTLVQLSEKLSPANPATR